MSESSNLLVIVAVAVVIGAILLAGQLAFWSFTARKDESQREIARRLGTLPEKAMTPLIRFGSGGGREGLAGWLDETLRSAGSPYPVETLLRRVLVYGLVAVLVPAAIWKSPWALVGTFAALIPIWLLARAAEARMKRLTEQLPDGLDLLARSLQAGHGLGESLRMVAEEMPEPLASEFGRVFEEQNLGRDTRECFQNLCRRNPSSFDLRIFVSSVLLQRDTGGNLVEILQNIAHMIRERFVFQGKVQALTSEARFTAYILGGLPFAIGTIIFLKTPTYLAPLANDPLGRLMAVGGIIWFILGVFIMREISKVEI